MLVNAAIADLPGPLQVLSKLDAKQVASISAQAIAAISGEQLRALSGDAIEALTAEQLGALSSKQIASMTAEQLSRLTPSQLKVRPILQYLLRFGGCIPTWNRSSTSLMDETYIPDFRP